MSTKELSKMKRLFVCIGEIDDAILEEAETADIVADTAARKRYVKYGTLAAAATVGVATATFFLIKSRRAVAGA